MFEFLPLDCQWTREVTKSFASIRQATKWQWCRPISLRPECKQTQHTVQDRGMQSPDCRKLCRLPPLTPAIDAMQTQLQITETPLQRGGGWQMSTLCPHWSSTGRGRQGCGILVFIVGRQRWCPYGGSWKLELCESYKMVAAAVAGPLQ